MSFRLVFFIALLICYGCARRASDNSDVKSKSVKEDSIAYHSKVMADGKRWMTKNVSIKIENTFCQQNDERLCGKYGRLYTWRTAKRVCSSVGEGWHLPTNEEWQTLTKAYGGIYDDSNDKGNAAYIHLIDGGDAGFNALLGGNREPDGSYARLDAHGFYWTSSEYDSANAWFYNFGRSSQPLNHHTGNKQRAISVRCVKD